MPSQDEIRTRITARIIEALKDGTPPWRRPWTADPNSGFPVNIVSRNLYRGINPLILELTAMERNFRSRYWATYRQWQGLGCQVKKRPPDVAPGAWGTQIVFFKPIVKTTDDDGEEKEKRFFILKTYTVFNFDQVEDGGGLSEFRPCHATEEPRFVDYEPAEELIAATGARIHFGGSRAFYSPATDCIQCPRKEQFAEQHEYYGTLLHELAHWSESRLDWQGSYAIGELRAEIAACFLTAQLGIPRSEDMGNHHAYVAGWITALENDPKTIFKASADASKATDFLLSFSETVATVGPNQEVPF